ncbi:350_t:CDS:1 [Paraglomus brasilianum]|uniref:350_t:CDS:1 n=1 Tax=Paraglomus brasilianum TaxID=144538 RepID=A0A9N9FZ92_9GLOM|nr:350_t:CDS:1 [Paraglomus brasilianum]
MATLINDQYRIDLPSTNSLTPFEIILLNWPPYNLTLSLDVLLNPTYKGHIKQRRCKSHVRQRQPLPPRPQNAWILYRRDFEYRLRAQFPTILYTIHDVSKIAGDQWKVQSDVVKEYFCVLSKLAREQHRLAFPDYVYKPKRTKQREKNGEVVFKNMDKTTFTSRQNNRMHTQRNIKDTNIYNIKPPYQANESDMSTVVIDTDQYLAYENAHNGTWLEGLFQKDNNYNTPPVCHNLVSDNVYNNNICDADSTLIYPTDETIYLPIQDFVYNLSLFPFPISPKMVQFLRQQVCASSGNTYQMDIFNVNAQLAENNGQT